MKEGLRPHQYPAKRVSLGARQVPREATETRQEPRQEPRQAPPATPQPRKADLPADGDATPRQTGTGGQSRE